ncbi:hypothetical protein [Coprococcus comes]|uniref:hypothetical protein n=1 Tax=Coprococcus comes TaxID=410072 RepID=UPI00321A1EF7
MRKYLKKIIVALLIIFGIEVIFFNFRFWESLNYTPRKIEKFELGSGIEKLNDDFYRITDTENAYIEIKNLNLEIKNIYADVNVSDDDQGENRYLAIQISMTDAANSEYRQLPVINIVKRTEESRYIKTHFSEKSEKIKINFNAVEGTKIYINSITFNEKKPFIIHPIRIGVLFVLYCLILLFSPKSQIYKKEINMKNKSQKILIVFFAFLNVLIVLGVGVAIRPYNTLENGQWAPDVEYQELADAIIDGQFSLELPVSKTLKEMENPYDPVKRDQLMKEAGEWYYVDHAFYKGKYYCYFGIVPALLFFVPYKLITGHHLHTWVAVILCGELYCIASYIFVYILQKKYFKKNSLGIYLLGTNIFIAMSSIVYLVFYGNVYSIPIMLAILLGILGLSFWIEASGKEKINKLYLIIGATCIALIIGCRPQLAIIVLLAFPIFWNDIKERKFFSLKGISNTLCVIIPFLIVGFSIMGYNYVRFGSVMDFGANYNLTSNDMTHRGVEFDRNWLGVFEYLFQPLNITSRFPFMKVIGDNVLTDYQGYVSQEPLFGGFLWFNPTIVCCWYLKKYKEEHKKSSGWGIAVGAFASAIIIILVTIQMSGMTQRYMSDFGWMFAISTIVAMLYLDEKTLNNTVIRKVFLQGIVGLVLVTTVLNYWNIFMDGRYHALVESNPNVYFWIKYVFFTI